jgi:hypothetical protein
MQPYIFVLDNPLLCYIPALIAIPFPTMNLRTQSELRIFLGYYLKRCSL